MPASCKCTNGHTFTSRITEDSPEINVLDVFDEACPECGADFVITDINDDGPDWALQDSNL